MEHQEQEFEPMDSEGESTEFYCPPVYDNNDSQQLDFLAYMML